MQKSAVVLIVDWRADNPSHGAKAQQAYHPHSILKAALCGFYYFVYLQSAGSGKNFAKMDSTLQKYLELEKKINQARLQDYLIVRSSDGKPSPYEIQRQEIIDKYFLGYQGAETKERLLDLFENINQILAATLGI